MISFCKKSIHSFFNLHIPTTTTDHNLHNSPAGKCGLGLITGAPEPPRPTNVIDRLALTPPVSPPPQLSMVKKDPGGVGFVDEIGGSSDGLTSCTESLGFESSVERKFDDEEIEFGEVKEVAPTWRRNSGKRREKKKFPPPLSSLSCNGQPSFYLRPVRRDGRLELMEVRIERPEILRAHREDGRLRLHLVRNDFFDIKEEEEEENDEDQKVVQVQEERSQLQEEEEEEEEEEEDGESWSYGRVSGEGARRCHEVVRMSHGHDYHHRLPIDHHHHHNLHVCVTTR